MKNNLSEVVGEAVVDTINSLFGHTAISRRADNRTGFDKGIRVRVTVSKQDMSLDFNFNFEMQMLSSMAAGIYPKDCTTTPEICEDLAEEIANIVSNKAKSFLYDQGLELQMGFPEIERQLPIPSKDRINLYFAYKNTPAKENLGAIVHYDLHAATA